MSFHTVAEILKWKIKRSSDKFVLLAIASYANDENEAWVGHQRLCDDTGFSRRAMVNIIDRLVATGLIEKERQTRQNGSRTVDLLRISLVQNVHLRREESAKRVRKPKVHLVPTLSAPSAGPPEPVIEPSTLPIGKEPPAPTIGDPVHVLWQEGIGILKGLGLAEGKARQMVGKWQKFTGGNAVCVLAAIRAAATAGTQDPIPFVSKILKPSTPEPRGSGWLAAGRAEALESVGGRS